MERLDFRHWRKEGGSELARERHRARMLAHEDDARQMTALAIADCHADIVCLQEVESLQALERFEEDYLTPTTGLAYPQKICIEGNDTRGIDVALMAKGATRDGEKIELLSAKSHHDVRFGEMGVLTQELIKQGVNKNERVFRRDCLEVDLRIGGKRLTVFVCHFKSMGSSKAGMDGRLYTMPVRMAEARCVRQIIEQKFGTERVANMRWLVCGDLNDYTERLVIEGSARQGYRFSNVPEPTSGLEPLLVDGFSENLMNRRDADDRWTLYFASGIAPDDEDPDNRPVHHLVQLDYLLASPALATTNASALPHIIRKGQPVRTVFPPDQDVDRYPRTGWDRPKASDHCPVAVTLKMV